MEASGQHSVGWLFIGSRVPHSSNPMMIFSGRMSDPSPGNGKGLCDKDGAVHVVCEGSHASCMRSLAQVMHPYIRLLAQCETGFFVKV